MADNEFGKSNEVKVPVSGPTTEAPAPKKKSTRGFASMSPERQREIARKGGKAAHEKGTAHEFTPDEARVAGRKGGETVSRDRKHMATIGREGGQARGLRASQRRKEREESTVGATTPEETPVESASEEKAPELQGQGNVTRASFGQTSHEPPKRTEEHHGGGFSRSTGT